MGELEVYVATEQKFTLHRGTFYAEATGGREFWQRYLEVFKSVKIVARVIPVEQPSDNAVYVEAEGIEVVPLLLYTTLLLLHNLLLRTILRLLRIWRNGSMVHNLV